MVNKIRQDVRIPFFPADSNRDTFTVSTDKDSIIKNGFIDIRSNSSTKEQIPYLVKRPGIQRVLHPSNIGVDEYNCQGFWIFGDTIIAVYADIIYKLPMSSLPATAQYTTGMTIVYQTLVSQMYGWTWDGSTYINLKEQFGTDFQTDYAYNAVPYIDRNEGECLYITNGLETIVIKHDGTYFLPEEPVNLYQANTYYTPGDRVLASAYTNQTAYEYILLGEAGIAVLETTEPTWPTTSGDTVVSAGGNTWVTVPRRTATYSYTNRTYTAGQYVIPSTETGYYYIVTTGGTASAEPTWTELKDDTCTATGGVIFTCLGNYSRPGLMLPMPVYLDTFLVVNKYKTSDLYHSDPTDPNSWNPTNFISADSFTSYTRAIARYNNYIIAYGETDTELFYNNANTTGSTLSRHESFLLQIGAQHQKHVIVAESIIAWIGKSAMGGKAIWLLDGFEPREISTPWVNKMLEEEGIPGLDAGAFSIRIAGHNLLVWVLETSKVALVFDIGLGLWYYWTNEPQVTPVDNNPNDGGTPLSFVFNKASVYNNEVYLASSQTVYIAKFSTTVYQDETIYSWGAPMPIYFEVRTPKIDFGNRKRKFCHSLDIICDPVSSNMNVAWSDSPDDFARFALASSSATAITTTVDLSGRPRITPVGSFRRRSFRFFHDSNTALRLEGFDLTYTQGSN